MSSRLGELLVRNNLISTEQLQAALVEQKKNGGRLGSHLTKMGAIQEDDLLHFLSKQYGVPAVNLADFELDREIVRMMPRELLEKHVMIPINRSGNTLIVAMADPSNIFAIDEIKFTTNYNVEVVVAAEEAIKASIADMYKQEDIAEKGESSIDLEALSEEFGDDVDFVASEAETDDTAGGDDAPIVRMVNAILLDAIKKKASDIHVECYEKSMRVRFRIDGVMTEVMKPPLKAKNAIISRMKIMANLDIAERRLPQDGRIKLKMGKGKEMDFRVSVLPCLFGEKVVMRLLDKSNLQLDMTKLGFDVEQLADFKGCINKPYGMVLVTGPTGSGKTTTLYSALAELNGPEDNLSTAEDPVEFNLAGINQVNVQESIGLTFAAALRSFLRQDPDVIMVGEIRDFETAEIAVKAALTGHMVLSTLHTNDAPGTINRLLNMGIEPFLVASAVNCILAQRLARKICADCKQPTTYDEKLLLDVEVPKELIGTFQAYKGAGCATCNGTGYKGRVALYEVLVFTDKVKEFILNGASTQEIKTAAIKGGFQSLRMSGIKKIIAGVTTPEEIGRVSAPDRV